MKRQAVDAVKDKTVTKKPKLFKHLSVNFTGIRDGETIVGCNPLQSSDVEMEIRATLPYHPIDQAPVNIIRDRFKQLAFFSEMTLEERQAWLSENIKSYVSGNAHFIYLPHIFLTLQAKKTTYTTLTTRFPYDLQRLSHPTS